MPLPPAAALWLALAQDPGGALGPWTPTAAPEAPSASAPASAARPAPATPAASARPLAGSRPAATASEGTPAAARRFVFANLYGVSMGLFFPIPSLDITLFFGGTLRPRTSRLGFLWRTALGYQFTFSFGGADLAALAFGESGSGGESILLADPFLYHRHHLTAHGFGGRRGRFYYSMGGGLWFYQPYPVGLEGEARLGFRFGARDHHRVSGIVGGHLRLMGAFGGYPLPTAGIFIGLLLL